MVLGFLVAVALIVMLVFALKTRQKIRGYGKSNILWKKVKVVGEMEPAGDVEAWVSSRRAPPPSPPERQLLPGYGNTIALCLQN